MSERRGWILALGLVAGALLARRYLFGLVTVPTASMVPTLLPGDVAFYSRLADPLPGDVVVVERDDGVLHIKRLVAGPGTEVEIAEGRLYVDGQPTRQGEAGEVEWLDRDCGAHRARADQESIAGARWAVLPGGSHPRERVPDEQVFLLGDHRSSSSDSRQWGPAWRGSIRGVVRGVAFSRAPCGSLRLKRIGPLE